MVLLENASADMCKVELWCGCKGECGYGQGRTGVGAKESVDIDKVELVWVLGLIR